MYGKKTIDDVHAALAALPEGITAAFNLGHADVFPSTSGKENAATYLMSKFDADPSSSFLLCDDDNDVGAPRLRELRIACSGNMCARCHAREHDLPVSGRAEALEEGRSPQPPCPIACHGLASYHPELLQERLAETCLVTRVRSATSGLVFCVRKLSTVRDATTHSSKMHMRCRTLFGHAGLAKMLSKVFVPGFTSDSLRHLAEEDPDKFVVASKRGFLGIEEVLDKVDDHANAYVLG